MAATPESPVNSDADDRRSQIGTGSGTLVNRVGSYEAVIAGDGGALEELVSRQWAEPCDAIDWYYRAVALSRLGRRQDALDAYARAAELAPPWTGSASGQATRRTCGRADLPTEEPAPPAEDSSPSADPVVTLVGASRDFALSGVFLAVNLEETPPSPSPEPPRVAVAEERTPPEPEEATAGTGKVLGRDDGPPVDSRAEAEQVLGAPETFAAAEPVPRSEPRDSSGWYYHGVTLARMQRFEEALHAYERAVELDDCNAASWHYLGITLARLDRHADALAAYVRALELDCRNPAIWINHAMSLTRLGRHAQAQAAHDQAIKLDCAQEHRASRIAPRAGGLARLDRYRMGRPHRRRWR